MSCDVTKASACLETHWREDRPRDDSIWMLKHPNLQQVDMFQKSICLPSTEFIILHTLERFKARSVSGFLVEPSCERFREAKPRCRGRGHGWELRIIRCMRR